MTLIDEKAIVLRNDNVGPRLYIMELESPQVAPLVLPGQFVHMKLNGFGEHILRRPFSILDTDPKAGRMTILYQVVGEGTQFMTSAAPGRKTWGSRATTW